MYIIIFISDCPFKFNNLRPIDFGPTQICIWNFISLIHICTQKILIYSAK